MKFDEKSGGFRGHSPLGEGVAEDRRAGARGRHSPPLLKTILMTKELICGNFGYL